MRRICERTFHALALLLLLHGGASAGDPPSTAAERAKAVRLARELEAEPLAPSAPEKRQWLLKWWERIPDITVTVSNLLGPLPPDDHPYFDKVLVQLAFSGGAFMIEHPEQSKDEVAVQTAAVGGALKVYETLTQRMPGHRLPFLDELLVKRDDGRLRSYVASIVGNTAPKQ